MEFRTIVDIPRPEFAIEPCEPMLFVGSCFADSIGRRFREEGFPVAVNPYGVMYNPVSVLHSVERYSADVWPRVAFITLGTNHVYREKATGEIVDNCQKRPQSLFQEELLTVDACADALQQTVSVLRTRRPDVQVVFTVSPIRYRKYGYHESQLSKATLLLAVDKVITDFKYQTSNFQLSYFPAYEIVMDELRDYRFYAPDMLHPSAQAVEYIWQQLVAHYFSPRAQAYLSEWAPLKAALGHRPFNAESPEYRALMDKTMLKVAELQKKYPTFAFPK